MFHAEFALPLIIIFLIGALFCLREAKRKDILLGHPEEAPRELEIERWAS
jgi:hypothetical protein